ncbi:MAG: hypothetical protein ACLGIO_09910 [Acidimicrobiia bacterium]
MSRFEGPGGKCVVPHYRFRRQGPHADVHREVLSAALETDVGLAQFSATGQYVWVQVRRHSDVFVEHLRALALDQLVIEASEADTPWGR